MQAFTQDVSGQALFDRFSVRSHPTVMIFDGEGQPVDWITGYTPPAEDYKKRVDQSLRGEETVKSLKLKLAEDPNDVGSTFKLGLKFDDFGDQARASELYRKVLALDPEGKKGPADF